MNYFNIQNEILKSAYKRDFANKPFLGFYGTTDESVVISDNYKLVIIPQKKCYLNLENVFQGRESVNLKSILDDSKYKNVFKNDYGKLVNSKVIVVFNFDDKDEEIWIDAKLLKDFDLENSTFKGIDKKSPLLIYENEELVGLVLPIRHD